MKKFLFIIIVVTLTAALNVNAKTNTTGAPLKLPEGFSISIFAKGLDKPRVIIQDPDKNLVVSIPSQGRVVALPDKNKDGKADKVITILNRLNKPHGLALRCKNKSNCKLYVAEINQVVTYDYNTKTLKAKNKKKIIALPGGGNHFTRTILFIKTPKGDKLLTSVGSTCNVCNEKDWRRAKILISDSDGKNLRTFASGLRNSVFMTAHPVTQKIWATEMGRDLLGDDLPPDEINIVEKEKDYGWPICYGKNIQDTDFNPAPEPSVRYGASKNVCESSVPSYIDIQAHSAPLGLAFVPKGKWSQEYWNHLLVSYHGSWNRSVPTGYKIVRYKLDGQGNYLGEEDFISGWLQADGKVLGRPVDILIQKDGVMYISDDKGGVIYRVSYERIVDK